MSELKPCPFCESRAVVVDCGAEDGDPNAGGITVECVACRASVAVAFGENAHNAVCAAWNRRAEPPRGEALQWYADLATLRGYESLLAAVVGGAPLPKAAATDLLETIRRVRLAALPREPGRLAGEDDGTCVCGRDHQKVQRQQRGGRQCRPQAAAWYPG